MADFMHKSLLIKVNMLGHKMVHACFLILLCLLSQYVHLCMFVSEDIHVNNTYFDIIDLYHFQTSNKSYALALE